MSQPDDERDDRNLAQQYADEYGGPDHDASLLSEPADEDLPGPDPPSPTGAGEVDPEIRNLFWRLVLVFNVAIAALALGPMLIYFRGALELGLQVTAGGALTFAYGVFRYRRFRATDDEAPERNG
ncbi:hypothetical protein OB920_07510 [Halobacteria archaeon HArc-gm2]|nr:hypothetical protein [Halobacteria archaeon HArc-gm2]